MYYAYINEQGICHTVSDTKLEGIGTKELTVETMDVLGMKYENGEWVEVPTPEPPLSETEQAILDAAVNVDYLVCMKELEI